MTRRAPYEEVSAGVVRYEPGVRVFQEQAPVKPLPPSKGNGPLDSGLQPVTVVTGRHRRKVLRS